MVRVARHLLFLVPFVFASFCIKEVLHLWAGMRILLAFLVSYQEVHEKVVEPYNGAVATTFDFLICRGIQGGEGPGHA